jgi:hypothetical protein
LHSSEVVVQTPANEWLQWLGRLGDFLEPPLGVLEVND